MKTKLQVVRSLVVSVCLLLCMTLFASNAIAAGSDVVEECIVTQSSPNCIVNIDSSLPGKELLVANNTPDRIRAVRDNECRGIVTDIDPGFYDSTNYGCYYNGEGVIQAPRVTVGNITIRYIQSK